MKKAIRILSILSAAVAALAGAALLICIVLQRPLAELINGHIPDAARGYFIVPIGSTIYLLGLLAVAVLLCFSAGSNAIGGWADILLAILGGLILPAVRWGIGLVESGLLTSIANARGEAYIVYRSLTNVLWNLPNGIGYPALVLALLVCGMSIAYKHKK